MNHLLPIFHTSHGVAHADNGAGSLGGMLLLAVAILLICGGIYRLTVPIERLWEVYERARRARGLAAVRDSAWERLARLRGWVSLGVGACLMIFSLATAASFSSVSEGEKMSDVRINGRQLTEREWEACGKQPSSCMEMYGSRGQ